MPKPVILTGLRTNAEYHLGNYLGAILPMVQLQKEHIGEYQINMFAPDLHSFTTPIDHDGLFERTLHNLRVFVAAGMPVDDYDFYLYRQSYVPAHAELTWILDCFTGFGEASRMVEFKDKSDKLGPDSNRVNVGLFNYPVLMAADILLYGARWIPVGEDQRQHIELTRDVALRLNNKFGDLFVVPEEWNKQLEFAHRLEGVRIRSLRNPNKKMSKSVDDPSGTIQLSDSPKGARQKIMKAETDSVGVINWDWDKQPGVTNLMQIFELLSATPHDQVLKKWQGQTSYGPLKEAVAEEVENFLAEFGQNLSSVNAQQLESKLAASEAAMNEVANTTLLRVQRAVGLRPPA